MSGRGVLFERGKIHSSGFRNGAIPAKPPGSGQGKGQGVGGGRGTGKGQGRGLASALVALTSISATSSRGAVTPDVAGALTLLSTTTLAADGTFDVSSINQSYNDLVISALLRGTRVATLDSAVMRFNNDSAANYDWQLLQGNNVTASTTGNAGSTQFDLADAIPAASAFANAFANLEVVIPGYTSTTWFKTFTCTYGHPISSRYAAIQTGTWHSTAAITRIQIFGGITANLLAGSQLRIYGRL